MVHFPWCCSDRLCIHLPVTGHDSSRVTPFGNLRVTGCVLLTVAFRSLPRPSSPDSPKAFTVNSYSLDHIYQYRQSLRMRTPLGSTPLRTTHDRHSFFNAQDTRSVLRSYIQTLRPRSPDTASSESKTKNFVHLCLFPFSKL